MSKKKSSPAGLQALYARACGLDVHKKLVVACVRILDSKDGTVQSTLRKFGTMTADLLELRQWLAELKVTHVAMESTGVYWQPVFNLLEGHFQCSGSFKVILAIQDRKLRIRKFSDTRDAGSHFLQIVHLLFERRRAGDRVRKPRPAPIQQH